MIAVCALWSVLQPHVDDPKFWTREKEFGSFLECETAADDKNKALASAGPRYWVAQPAAWAPDAFAKPNGEIR